MLVVLHHVLHARAGIFSPFAHSPNFGRPGVLIFFVISGFVMMHACRKEPPLVFARRRIIRVVPLYWLMTLVFFAIVFRNDLSAGEPLRRVPELLQSLFFVPHYHSGVSTAIWPILVPGWTLNYEMFFFLIFAIGIVFGRPAPIAVAILLGLVIAGWIFPSDNPIWITWTNEFLLLFVAGIALALLWQRTDFSHFAWLLPVGLALVFVSAMQLLPQGWIVPVFYISAIVTVAGTLAMQDRNPDRSAKVLALIGDASYSIYLSHTIVMIFLYKVLRKIPLDGWAQFIVVASLSLTICAAVGIALYYLVERPIIRLFRRRSGATWL